MTQPVLIVTAWWSTSQPWWYLCWSHIQKTERHLVCILKNHTESHVCYSNLNCKTMGLSKQCYLLSPSILPWNECTNLKEDHLCRIPKLSKLPFGCSHTTNKNTFPFKQKTPPFSCLITKASKGKGLRSNLQPAWPMTHPWGLLCSIHLYKFLNQDVAFQSLPAL